MTIPTACMSAYAVVGPTKRNPRRLSSLASAVDSAVTAGTSPIRRGTVPRIGWNDHSSALRPSGSSAATRALATVAVILARLRTMPASAISRSTSRSPKRATAWIENPSNAARNASRLRRMVSQDRPDWNASSVSRSNIASSPRLGRPHSVSW